MIKLWAINKHLLAGMKVRVPIEFTSFKFSGGEVQVRLPLQQFLPDKLEILAKLYSSDDIMQLFLLTDAIRGIYNRTPIHVTVPYLPYARQDRRCAPGEAASLRVFCNMIDAQNYAEVCVWDQHSEVSRPKRCFNIHPKEFVAKVPLDFTETWLVAPDKGASLKTRQTAYRVDTKWMQALKTRDPNDGSLGGVTIDYYSFGPKLNKDLLIVDDICDGGRTFINLAKELKKITTGKIYLYVTHGIFSQGLAPLEHAGIDHVWCPHIWPNWLGTAKDPNTWIGNYLTEIKR